MNITEQFVRRSLREDGWVVLRNGWPDFLCTRNGEVIAVEVKRSKPILSNQQADTHKALSACGLKTFVYVCSKQNIEERIPYCDIPVRSKRVARKTSIVQELPANVIELVDVEMWKCLRCGHLWEKKSDEKPLRCASCKSPYWDKPRKQK